MNQESIKFVVFHKETKKVVLVTLDEKTALDYLFNNIGLDGEIQYSYQWNFHN